MVELARPTGDPEQRNIPSEGIVHCRIGADSGAPWLGVSPLARAGVTAEQLAYIEARLRDDSKAVTGYLIPVPAGTPTERAAAAAAAVQGRGGWAHPH